MDAFDRKILGELVRDARQTYASIGETVGLSAPAVHDRVKRLKAQKIVKESAALLDGHSVGKPFLAFVMVNTDLRGKAEQMRPLMAFPEVEEIHSVTGDACLLMKVRTENAQAMEELLERVYALPGVTGLKSYVALATYLERPVQAEITEDWTRTD
jgi:DNA-binding Lrp family transcriptional regulator